MENQKKKTLIIVIAIVLALLIILGIVLGVVLSKPKEFTITFNSNGGSGIDNITIKKNNTITKPSDPVRDGYIFKGWFKDESLSKEWNFSTDKVTSDTKLYAKWEKKEEQVIVAPKYTVTFETGGGSEVSAITNLEKGSKITAPIEPVKDGFVFKGWFKEAELQNEWNFENDSVTKDTTLYAKYVELFEVTFMVDGEPYGEVQIIEEGLLVSKPQNPEKIADKEFTYTFNCWVLNGIEFDFSTPVTNDIILNATFDKTINSYAVTFNVNGGNETIASQTIEYNGVVTKPVDPTKLADKEFTYTFDKWLLNGIEYDFSTPVIEDIELVAEYSKTINQYSVTFEENGGSDVTDIPAIDYGSNIIEPTAPIKTGFVFKGWFTDNEIFENAWNFETDTITGDTTLYAKWVELFEVTFMVEGEQYGEVQTIEKGQTAVAPQEPTKPSNAEFTYEFENWLLNGGVYDFNTPVTSDITLNANFSSIINKYSVTFISEGDSPKIIKDIEYGNNLEELLDTPTKDGYVFKGWYKDNETFENAWSFETDFVKGNTTLYAKWVELFEVTFMVEGEQYGEVQIVEEGQLASKPQDPEKEATLDIVYKFDCWLLNGERFDFSTPVTSNIELVARYTEEDVSMFTFTPNNTENPEYYSVKARNTSISGDIIIPSTYKGLPVTSVDNYAFNACKTLTSVTIPNSVTNIGDYAFMGCNNLTSVNIPNEVTTIGGGAFDSCTALETIVIPESVTSIGANAFYQCSNLIITCEIAEFEKPSGWVSTWSSDVQVVWANAYTITFTSDDEQYGDIINIREGFTVAKPNDPIKEGYTFGGWFIDNETFEDAYNFDSQVTANVNLYAKWTINQYSITFEENGGSEVTDIPAIDYGSNIIEPTAPIKTGFVFKGWFTDNEIFENAWDFETDTITGDTILYAKWVEVFEVTFMSDGIQYGEVQKVEYGNSAIAPSDPVNKNTENYIYVFEKWDKPFDNVTSNLIINAIFAEKDIESLFTFTLEASQKSYAISKQAGATLPKNFVIPSTYNGKPVTRVLEFSFQNCKELESVIVSEGIHTVSQRCFFNCRNLKSVTLPNSLWGIGDSVFKDCTALKEITIPANVGEISFQAFVGCTGLERITFENPNDWLASANTADPSSYVPINFSNPVNNVKLLQDIKWQGFKRR